MRIPERPEVEGLFVKRYSAGDQITHGVLRRFFGVVPALLHPNATMAKTIKEAAVTAAVGGPVAYASDTATRKLVDWWKRRRQRKEQQPGVPA